METHRSRQSLTVEIPAHRIRHHGLQLGERIALRANATARRIVPTGHEPSRLGARSDSENQFHVRTLPPLPLRSNQSSRILRMKPPRQNVGKAGTQGTKPLPDGAGIAVRPFPIHRFNAAFDAPHDLGEILTPEQMAARVPLAPTPADINRAARKALDALIGCGPKQTVPHLDTALLLAEGLARLRDFALAGDAAAMRSLGDVLSQAVADLAELARKKPEVVREWSRKQNVVPVLTGKNAAQTGTKKDVGQLRRDLEDFDVGALSPYKINPAPKVGGGTFNAATPVDALAGLLVHHLGNYRYSTLLMAHPVPKWAQLAADLTELTKANATQWREAAWECLMSATGSQPEKHTDLGKGRASEGPGAEREMIKKSLLDAIKRMARKLE